MNKFINGDFPRHSCESCSYWTLCTLNMVCKNPRSLNYNDITRYDHGCALWDPSSSAKLSDGSDPSDKSDQSVSSVNTLESLVPPLDLCRKIPEGQFSRSVFCLVIFLRQAQNRTIP